VRNITLVRDTARMLKGKVFTAYDISKHTGIPASTVGSCLGHITEVKALEFVEIRPQCYHSYKWVGP